MGCWRKQSRTAGTLVCLCLASCVEFSDPGDVTGPEEPSDLRVVASAMPASVLEGASSEVSAAPTGGQPPYQVRWDQNGGPSEIDIDDAALASFSVGPLSDPGLYVLRVTVTDAEGHHATDYAQIQVLSGVEATAPPLAVVGDAEAITAEVPDQPAGTEYLWEVTGGEASIAAPDEPTTTITAEEPGTIDLRLRVTIPSPGSTPTPIVRTFEIAAIANLGPRVLVETSAGDFTLELDAAAAPLHTANFLLYVDDGFYEGLLIHRVVCTNNGDGTCQPFVIQGGGYEREGDEIVEVEATRDPVTSEADNGLSNGDLYTVALALRGGNRNSGTTQFFINLDDNSFLNSQGFTVFATVTSGRAVVDAITQVETENSSVIPGEKSQPVEDIVIERMSRIVQ